MQHLTPDPRPSGGFRDARRFWEPRRLWYNAVLTGIVLVWLIATWPHFRPALNLQALAQMLVLAFLANLCFSAAYLADFCAQGLLPKNLWRGFRWTVFAFGMLLAVLVENYWIADEIYPDVEHGAGGLAAGIKPMGAMMATNMNFPAPLAVLGFLTAGVGLVACVGAALIFWLARKPKFARRAVVAVGLGVVAYFALLVGFSVGSRDIALAQGQEKYFCEIDCHLAYAVTEVVMKPDRGATDCYVTLRTRFDETTISANRPPDAPLMPSPRAVWLVDASGHEYAPISTAGSSLITPLRPGDSYSTRLEFRVPTKVRALRLLLSDIPGWPDHFVIGDENSWLHKKTYFALEPASRLSI